MEKAIVIGSLLVVLVTAQAVANDKVCLLRSQLRSWHAIDETTLEMTDKRKNVYDVRFSDPCPEVAISTATVAFDRAWRDLACLAPGLTVSITARGVAGRRVCKVATVTVR